jgi:hypothetical protein
MSYTLTLTQAERKAIDWVGNRYRHGDELADILSASDCPGNWHDTGELTYTISEPDAWMIREIIDEDWHLSCFARDLVDKLHSLYERIV